MYEFLVEPFQYLFMKRALVSCLCLAAGCGPVGALLMLRRMSLMGDALSHAVLPGAAIGYLIAGLSLIAMGIGGFIAGLVVAILSGLVTRLTHLKEDASFAGFFLISMAMGVLIVSMRHNALDLIHVLFGNGLAVDQSSLVMIASISSLTLLILAIICRPLIVECFDPSYLRSVHGKGSIYHLLFLIMVVMNLVAGFQALGTLLALGMMMLPAISARFWSRKIWWLCFIAIGLGMISGYIGLLIAYYQDLPSGPSVVLVAGVIYVISLLTGSYGSIWKTLSQKKR
jgi:zinc/manganese transport system permease protein